MIYIGEERSGATVTSRISLRPGLNALMAVIPRSYAPASSDLRMGLVAKALGDAIGETARYVGRDPTGITRSLVYVIGHGRPVYVNEVESTKKWDSWYEKLGAPMGPDVIYLPVNIDWRGPVRVIDAPVGAVGFPNGMAPHVIGSNWPDGDYEQQVAYLNASAANASATGFYRHMSDGMKAVDSFIGEAVKSNFGAIIGWTVALGIVTYIFASVVTKEVVRAPARLGSSR